MDIRKLSLRFDEGRGTVTVIDAAGERVLPLEGDAFARVAATATIGSARGLEVDVAARRAWRDAGDAVTELDGADFDALTPLLRAAVSEARPPRPELDVGPSDAAFWQTLYEHGVDGWELTRAAPPLERWFDAQPPRGRQALVVGCGRGHEARMLASRGAEVVAVDFAPEAIAEARRLAHGAGLGAHIDFRERDLFRLLDDPERYDLIVEHCCFCAIEPQRRQEYVEVMARLLVDGGELVGLFWSHGRSGGPPFSVDAAELERLFSPRFVLAQISVPPDSVPLRQGQELLARWRRR